MNLNVTVFKAINGIAYGSKILDKTMIVFSKYGPLIFMITLAALYLYGVYRKDKLIRWVAVDTFAITVISLFIGFAIGILYYEPRPFITGKVNLLTPHVPDASFPSDHSLGTMSIALGINSYNKNCGIILIILSILVGVSRVYVGVHYPADVFGSYLIVLIINFLYRNLLKDKIRGIYSKVEEYLIKGIFLIKRER